MRILQAEQTLRCHAGVRAYSPNLAALGTMKATKRIGEAWRHGSV
jgi:hypothetical protein